MPTASDINRLTYLGAAKLKEEMSRPGGQPEKLDFSIMAGCFNCNRPMSQHTGQKLLVCSGCKSAIYCSKKCQVGDWKIGRFGSDGHKTFCEKNKVGEHRSGEVRAFILYILQRHMLKVPEVRAILKLFPWGKLESDGTFSESLIRAYFGVLGANGYGYWSEAGGSAPHQLQPNTLGNQGSPFRVDPVESYQDGYLLFLDRHLDDKAGWNLEDRLIPKLHFEPGCEPPIGSSANVVDWKSWYQWRYLPFDSPAALLMHYPLTVYQLLVNVLNVTSPSCGSSEHRQTLNIHYLGAEVELNMLPLFSELALLLPYTDIKLTFFGYAVHTIVQKANKRSIAAKAKRNEPVYTYESPASMGQSTLAIYLDGDQENWDPRFTSITNNLPDAIVALNAGLLSYRAWMSVILFCHVEEMPFGVTEYAEQSAEVQRDSFSKIIHHAIPSLGPRMSRAQLEDLVRPRKYPIELNPFQRPGQRPIGATRLPNLSNGFTIRIVGRDSVKGKGEDSLVREPSYKHVAEQRVQQLVDKTEGVSLNDLD
ncbi:hypothetical protein J3R82DRAFT_973 [Butyriboletus roseoflavus]|nr:hypothetical protein J3R82DRAFT_973 [Butyriboletus roseoflavus]